MRTVIFHGGHETRDVIKHHDWNLKDSSGKVIKGVYKFEIVVTTYEMVMAEIKMFTSVQWEYVVLDEGHRIKNVNSKILDKLKSIPAKRILLMTGTPLQNSTKELWTMINFLDPEKVQFVTIDVDIVV
jgi:SNF2 family DNA or RNA helicase